MQKWAVTVTGVENHGRYQKYTELGLLESLRALRLHCWKVGTVVGARVGAAVGVGVGRAVGVAVDTAKSQATPKRTGTFRSVAIIDADQKSSSCSHQRLPTGEMALASAPNQTAISIIGTAGRQGADRHLNKSVFSKMVAAAERIITEDWKLDPGQVELVSGGAAWSDHVAVSLWTSRLLQPSGSFQRLTLHLPAKWDRRAMRFDESSEAGRASNHYHRLFSRALGEEDVSLKELGGVIALGATVVDSYAGFLERNNAVAGSDRMIAFGIEAGEPPKRSGTGYTWSRFKAGKGSGRKRYVRIGDL